MSDGRCGHNVPRPVNDSSTTNLTSHHSVCLLREVAEREQLKLNELGLQYEEAPKEELAQAAALWCARNARPFLIVKDVSLRPLLSKVAREHLPSPQTIARGVSDLAAYGRAGMIKELAKVKGAIYLGLDGWTTPNRWSLLGTAEAHTANNMAKLVKDVLASYEIEKKVAGIISDNASNMAAMIDKIGKSGRLDKRVTWVQCFGHILNLVAKAVLQPFRTKLGNGVPEHDAPYEPDLSPAEQAYILAELEAAIPEPDGVGADNEVTEAELQRELAEREKVDKEKAQATAAVARGLARRQQSDGLSNPERLALSFWTEGEGDEYSTRDCRFSLDKLQVIAKKLAYNTGARLLLVKICTELGLSTPHNIPRRVPTRWNSDYEQLQAAVERWDALLHWQDEFTDWPGENHLVDRDLALFKHLRVVLQPMYDLTHEFSALGSPLVDRVVSAMDEMTSTFDNYLFHHSYPPALHNAILRGHLTVQKYYAKSDDSVFYRLAILLHPSKRKAYLQEQDWPEEWQEEALKLAKAYRDKWYSGRSYSTTPDFHATPTPSSMLNQPLTAAQRMQARAEADPAVTSDPLDSFVSATPTFDRAADGTVHDKGAVDFWLGQQRAAGGFGRDALADLGVDIFTCPATSVDVERAFSRGRRVVSEFQHSLSPQRIADTLSLSFYARKSTAQPRTDAQTSVAAQSHPCDASTPTTNPLTSPHLPAWQQRYKLPRPFSTASPITHLLGPSLIVVASHRAPPTPLLKHINLHRQVVAVQHLRRRLPLHLATPTPSPHTSLSSPYPNMTGPNPKRQLSSPTKPECSGNRRKEASTTSAPPPSSSSDEEMSDSGSDESVIVQLNSFHPPSVTSTRSGEGEDLKPTIPTIDATIPNGFVEGIVGEAFSMIADTNGVYEGLVEDEGNYVEPATPTPLRPISLIAPETYGGPELKAPSFTDPTPIKASKYEFNRVDSLTLRDGPPISLGPVTVPKLRNSTLAFTIRGGQVGNGIFHCKSFKENTWKENTWKENVGQLASLLLGDIRCKSYTHSTVSGNTQVLLVFAVDAGGWTTKDITSINTLIDIGIFINLVHHPHFTGNPSSSLMMALKGLFGPVLNNKVCLIVNQCELEGGDAPGSPWTCLESHESQLPTTFTLTITSLIISGRRKILTITQISSAFKAAASSTSGRSLAAAKIHMFKGMDRDDVEFDPNVPVFWIWMTLTADVPHSLSFNVEANPEGEDQEDWNFRLAYAKPASMAGVLAHR
ncbi:hypothetical protein JCM1840_005033 [Sporobolomyces johnsonii]